VHDAPDQVAGRGEGFHKVLTVATRAQTQEAPDLPVMEVTIQVDGTLAKWPDVKCTSS